jgi:nucleoid-associated protein YgaU
MKTTQSIFVLFFLMTMLGTHLHAQEQTKDEWQHAMQQAITTRDDLKNQVNALEKEVLALRQRDTSLTTLVRNCQKELLGLLDRTAVQEKEFLALLDQIDARLNEFQKLSENDLWIQRDKLDSIQTIMSNTKTKRMALIPEYSSRLEDQQHRLNLLRSSLHEPKEQPMTYIVGTWKHDRDCLWNISKKLKIYDDPSLWPKIWQENRDQIKDPDKIHTGQRLIIPPKAPLTHSEKIAEQMYWKDKQKEKGSLSSNP